MRRPSPDGSLRERPDVRSDVRSDPTRPDPIRCDAMRRLAAILTFSLCRACSLPLRLAVVHVRWLGWVPLRFSRDMGILFSRLWQAFGEKEARILVLGLDNAGKTTILYRLQVGTVVSTIPTIGFNVETVTYKNIKFQVWDLGGQTSIRPYWRCYYPNTQAIIYVVDSSDVERVGTSRQEFHAILEEEELADAVVLVYANKQDLPGALSDAQITEGLGLAEIKDRQWAIFKTSAIKGEGLWEGMEWLSNTLKAK